MQLVVGRITRPHGVRGEVSVEVRTDEPDRLYLTAPDKEDAVVSQVAGTLGGALSYGQRKLLELAAVMMARPELVLLDEPAGGVNPVLLERIAEHIRQLNRQGVTFLLVEHNMSFVMNLCHEVVVLQQGKVIATGKPREIRENPAVLDAYLGA